MFSYWHRVQLSRALCCALFLIFGLFCPLPGRTPVGATSIHPLRAAVEAADAVRVKELLLAGTHSGAVVQTLLHILAGRAVDSTLQDELELGVLLTWGGTFVLDAQSPIGDAPRLGKSHLTYLKQVAQLQRQQATAQLLIEHGADMNDQRNCGGRTPLHTAVLARSIALTQLFLSHGANVNAQIKPLRQLCPDTRHQAVDALALGPDPLDDGKGRAGLTSLHLAAFQGSLKIATLLLAAGANLEAQDASKRTPLHIAARLERHSFYIAIWSSAVTRLLLAHGADVAVRDEHGHTPLHRARRETTALLLAYGSDVNARNKYGETPLHLVTGRGKKESIEQFLAYGANVNTLTQFGEAPLHIAAASGNVAAAKVLLTHGADISGGSPGHVTPLSLAIKFGKKDMVTFLRQHGAQE